MFGGCAFRKSSFMLLWKRDVGGGFTFAFQFYELKANTITTAAVLHDVFPILNTTMVGLFWPIGVTGTL